VARTPDERAAEWLEKLLSRGERATGGGEGLGTRPGGQGGASSLCNERLTLPAGNGAGAVESTTAPAENLDEPTTNPTYTST
jgi:hypothetical protein